MNASRENLHTLRNIALMLVAAYLLSSMLASRGVLRREAGLDAPSETAGRLPQGGQP